MYGSYKKEESNLSYGIGFLIFSGIMAFYFFNVNSYTCEGLTQEECQETLYEGREYDQRGQ